VEYLWANGFGYENSDERGVSEREREITVYI
jgi:hypothetical protein